MCVYTRMNNRQNRVLFCEAQATHGPKKKPDRRMTIGDTKTSAPFKATVSTPRNPDHLFGETIVAGVFFDRGVGGDHRSVEDEVTRYKKKMGKGSKKRVREESNVIPAPEGANLLVYHLSTLKNFLVIQKVFHHAYFSPIAWFFVCVIAIVGTVVKIVYYRPASLVGDTAMQAREVVLMNAMIALCWTFIMSICYFCVRHAGTVLKACWAFTKRTCKCFCCGCCNNAKESWSEATYVARANLVPKKKRIRFVGEESDTDEDEEDDDDEDEEVVVAAKKAKVGREKKSKPERVIVQNREAGLFSYDNGHGVKIELSGTVAPECKQAVYTLINALDSYDQHVRPRS